MSVEIGNEAWFISRFEQTGAIMKSGHFVGKSGLHLDSYVENDLITSEPELVSELVSTLVSIHSKAWFDRVDLVIAPAGGAELFGGMLALEIGCKFAFTVKQEGKQTLQRSFYRLVQGRIRVLLADDILTTGETLRELARAVESFEAEVVGAAVIWKRSDPNLDYPIAAIVDKKLPNWSEESCILCQQGVRIRTDVGHGLDFVGKYGMNPVNWPANRVAGI